MDVDGKVPGLTGAILAGGQARRMGGVNKGLPCVGGVPIVDRVIATLATCSEQIIVIANQPDPYIERSLAVVPDLLPGTGTLGGIYTALMTAQTDIVFVGACDMPFVCEPLIRCLAARLGSNDAVVPRDDYGLQPMHAVYARRPRALLGERLQERHLKVEHFLDAINVMYLRRHEFAPLEPQRLAFINVNRPEDLQRAEAACRFVPMPQGPSE